MRQLLWCYSYSLSCTHKLLLFAFSPKVLFSFTVMQPLQPARPLTDEENEKIATLQHEIDAIWSKKGDYKVDDEGWRTMPIFMEEINEKDVAENSGCAALSAVLYDNIPPESIAKKMKEQGNKAMEYALNPEQVNRENHARVAVKCYTEAIEAKCENRKITSQLYCNRALANFVMQNFGRGLQDAQKAILLDIEYTKAYFRGAKCAERIRKYDLARSLIEKGLQTSPDEASMRDFNGLLQVVTQGMESERTTQQKERVRAKAGAAESANIVRTMQTRGINIATQCEVSSEQWAQWGHEKPYFDTEGTLHVSILFMYDEHDITDFQKDVACDFSLAEIVADMMPFPWDTDHRYEKLEDLLCLYKIDDGVAVPKYYVADPSWQLFEVFRTSTYVMPNILPVFHVVPRTSELLQRWGVSAQ